MNRVSDAAARRAAARYNLALNLFWSALAFVPLTVYACGHFTSGQLWLFSGLSALPFFIPNRSFDEMRMVRKPSFYSKLGVGAVLALVQNGVLVNRLLRRRFPRYKVLRPGRDSLKKLVAQTFLFEKFHWGMLLFFGFTTAVAAGNGDGGWALALLGINVFYNVYPILLQQFIRCKLGFR